MKLLLILVLCILPLTGCVNSEKYDHNSNKNIGLDRIDQEPVSKAVIKDGFELKITSAKRVYSITRLFNTEPLDIIATLTYIGTEENIEIWYASRVGTIFLYNENGSAKIGPEMNPLEKHTTLEKEESIIITHDFTHSFYIDKLVEGDYTAVANVSIIYNVDTKQELTISVDIPFTINK